VHTGQMDSKTTNTKGHGHDKRTSLGIFVLQVGLIGILAFVSGFAFWGSNFATSTVHDQLADRQIYFPARRLDGDHLAGPRWTQPR